MEDWAGLVLTQMPLIPFLLVFACYIHKTWRKIPEMCGVHVFFSGSVLHAIIITFQNGFALPNVGQLDILLSRLVEMLESTKCKEVTSCLVDFFFDAVVHVSFELL